jgi:hypothetical protein
MLRMNSLKNEITKHQMRRMESLSLDSRGVDNSRHSARNASTSFATKLHPLPVASMHLTSRYYFWYSTGIQQCVHMHTHTHTHTHIFWYSTGNTAIINSCISLLLHSHCKKFDNTVGFLSCSKKSRVDRSLLGSSAKALVWDLEEGTLKNNHLRRSATSLGFTRS